MNYYEAMSRGIPPEEELARLMRQEAKDVQDMDSDINELERELIRRDIIRSRKDIKSIRYHLKNPHNNDDITEDDIQRARDYPVTQLVEFNTMGKALAWCHEDKSPSLSYWAKGNNCRCFVCDVSYDSIKILMDRDNYSFIEAVRKLR